MPGSPRAALRWRVAMGRGRLQLWLCFAAIWAFAQSPPLRAQDRVQIVTTTTDLRSLAEAVGGDLIEAVNLVPANFDAEEYQPKPRDVLRLKNARLAVRVGLDYDLWFDRLLQAAAMPEIQRGGSGYVDASFGVAALEVREPWCGRWPCPWQRQSALLAGPEERRIHHREHSCRTDPRRPGERGDLRGQ
jgi:ABC-type Zn uptake system ZnuABC Zn-binding protein ZnuA